MDTEILRNIQTAWDRTKKQTITNVINALIEGGVTENHQTEIFHFINTNAIPLELGKSPESIFYEFMDVRMRSLREQEDRGKLVAIDNQIKLLEQFLVAYTQNRDALNLENLKAPIADLVEMTGKIETTIKPPRIDFAELITPQTKEAIVKRIQEKPAALETSYQIADEPLRFQTGALSIIAAPTGHGKTSFLINLLLDATEQYPARRHWLFSYEEDLSSVVLKVLNTFCDNDYSKNNRRTLECFYREGKGNYFSTYNNPESGNTETRLEDFQKKEPEFWKLLQDGKINIIQADYSTEDLIKAIREVSNHKAGLIAIDYLQLLYPNNRDRYTTRQEELKRICLDLKDTAIDTGLAIVAAGQFNRDVRYPGAMEPQRIADASDIEKAANKVIGLWNGDKKPGNDKEAEKDLKPKGITKGTVYIEVLKARDEKSGISGVYPWNGNRGVIGRDPTKHPIQNHENNRKNNDITPGDLL